MLVSNIKDLYFSQSALAVYKKCALRFRYRYLDGLFWPQDWGGSEEQKELIELGNKFHRLAQRYYARGEEAPENILTGDIKLWLENLKEFRPYNQEDDFYPEQEIRINKDGIKVMAKFDLLYLSQRDDSLIIYDWKTYKKPLSADKLRQDIQTRLYLYILYQAGEKYLSENSAEVVGNKGKLKNRTQNRPLSGIVYWNPRFPREKVEIEYTEDMFVRDQQYFEKLIKEIISLDYQQFEAVDDPAVCKYCEYRPICHGKKAEFIEMEEDDLDLSLDWEAIDEIEF